MKIKYNAFFAVILAMGVLVGICVGYDCDYCPEAVRIGVGYPFTLSYNRSVVADLEDVWGAEIFSFIRYGAEIAIDDYWQANGFLMFGNEEWWFGGGPGYNFTDGSLEFYVFFDGMRKMYKKHPCFSTHLSTRLVFGRCLRAGITLGIEYSWGGI